MMNDMLFLNGVLYNDIRSTLFAISTEIIPTTSLLLLGDTFIPVTILPDPKLVRASVKTSY